MQDWKVENMYYFSLSPKFLYMLHSVLSGQTICFRNGSVFEEL